MSKIRQAYEELTIEDQEELNAAIDNFFNDTDLSDLDKYTAFLED